MYLEINELAKLRIISEIGGIDQCDRLLYPLVIIYRGVISQLIVPT
jgi:hypothetical protein